LAGNEQGQVLVTLDISFIIADICLLVWTGDPMPLAAPQALRPPLRIAGYAFPTYRLVVLAIALVAALALYLLMERTRLGAMIRAGVDDMEMARGVGLPVSRLFSSRAGYWACLAATAPARPHACPPSWVFSSRGAARSVSTARRWPVLLPMSSRVKAFVSFRRDGACSVP
jgi:branched-subunit amino acid ABC-type transport system permease component